MSMTRGVVNAEPRIFDEIFAPYNRSDAPGLVVGIALDGRPVYRRGFGLANMELPIYLSPDMRLRIGSVTKQFLCLLLLLLVDEGRLALEDSPRQYLPDLPAWSDRMTLRQLMSHTSGMRCSLDLILQISGAGKLVPEDTQMKLLCAQDDLNFEPGEHWCYNNGGYVLLSRIAEQITGQTLAQAFQHRLFEPIGMHDTVLRPYDTDCLPNSAALHVPVSGGGYVKGVFGPPIGGEGAISSTVNDMLRWLAHMAAPKVGTADSWDMMLTPIAPNGYGLGVFSSLYRGARVIHHSGVVIGGACQMAKLPDHGVDIIMMSNRSGGIDLAALTLAVIEACVGGLHDKPADDRTITPLTGDFHSPATGAFVRLSEEGGKQTALLYATKQYLRRDARGSLFSDTLTSDMHITPLRHGTSVAAIDLMECGRTERLQRVNAPANATVHSTAVGVYECARVDARATITQEHGRHLLKMQAPFGGMTYLLEPVAPELWLASTGTPLLPLGGLLELDPTGFQFSSQRTRRLRFIRKPRPNGTEPASRAKDLTSGPDT
jgi:CubicO group peptidase (beta-lactamase class C family)